MDELTSVVIKALLNEPLGWNIQETVHGTILYHHGIGLKIRLEFDSEPTHVNGLVLSLISRLRIKRAVYKSFAKRFQSNYEKMVEFQYQNLLNEP